MRGSYVAVEPPDRVVFTWGVAGRDGMLPGSSTVEITLTADGEETVVDLVHRDLPAAERPGHLEGWLRCIGMLQKAGAAETDA